MRVSSRALLAGVALDWALGDPEWFPHPVRGVGWMARQGERFWRRSGLSLRWAGICFWGSVVGSAVLVVRLTLPRRHAIWSDVFWIYCLLACRDLDVQSGQVVRELTNGDLGAARKKLSRIVGRDTAHLDESEVMRATVETVAENLSDGVIAPLFYLALAGPSAMAAYKAINTLDSMVGHRNEAYREFGWASARIDDIANLIPARLTAGLIAVSAAPLGLNGKRALQVAMRDGNTQPSPNAGYPEAAVAGALGVQLGGTNFYRGAKSSKPLLGNRERPLEPSLYPKLRRLLYLSEVLAVGLILVAKRWR